jgi:hypothetical protein
VTTTTSGSSPKITYFDAFNRKTKEQHTGFDGRKIISDIHYDDLGRVKQASLPYFVLVSECPRALVVLTGNLPSVEYSTDVLLLTMPLPVIVLLVLLPKLSYS